MTRLATVDPVDHGRIDITALRDLLGEPGSAVVDARSLAAYNGWRLHGEDRGGHIPGAIAFPATWLTTIDEGEVERLLREKGLLGAQTVVVYGAGDGDADRVASALWHLGQRGVRVLEPGWSAWAADASLPVDRLSNHTALVHTRWLRELIDAGRPEAAPAG